MHHITRTRRIILVRLYVINLFYKGIVIDYALSCSRVFNHNLSELILFGLAHMPGVEIPYPIRECVFNPVGVRIISSSGLCHIVIDFLHCYFFRLGLDSFDVKCWFEQVEYVIVRTLESRLLFIKGHNRRTRISVLPIDEEIDIIILVRVNVNIHSADFTAIIVVIKFYLGLLFNFCRICIDFQIVVSHSFSFLYWITHT